MMIFTLFAALAVAAPSASALDWANDPVVELRDSLAAAPPVAAPPGVPVPSPEPYRLEQALECRPEIIDAFKHAWSLAGSGRKDYEAAFVVYRTEAGYDVEFMPMTFEPFKLPVRYSPSSAVAIAHTHPDEALKTPGPGDYDAKVPNYVLSRSALYVTVPGTKRHRFVRRDWDEPCGNVS